MARAVEPDSEWQIGTAVVREAERERCFVIVLDEHGEVLDVSIVRGVVDEEVFERAFEKARAEASPGAPSRLRVPDTATAVLVEAAIPGLPIHVGETRLLASIRASLAIQPEREQETEAEDERDPLAARFVERALELHAARPWRLVTGEQAFRLRAPALALDEACVAIIGADGGAVGLMILETPEDVSRFVALSALGPTAKLPREAPFSMLSLRFGGPVGSPVPWIERLVRDRGAERCSREDYARVVVACEAILARVRMDEPGLVDGRHSRTSLHVAWTEGERFEIELEGPTDALAPTTDGPASRVRPAVPSSGRVARPQLTHRRRSGSRR